MPEPSEAAAGTPPAPREPDGIYQWHRREGDRLVARVLGPEINETSKEIRFRELYNSDCLLLPEECEFQKYRILIRKVGDATKVSADVVQKGRILREVTAEILGYREQ